MTQPLFRSEALDHQRERLWGDVVLTQPLSSMVYTVALAVVVTALIAFLVLGSFTRKETVPGYLVPVGGVTQVYAPQPGTASEVAVKAGDTVAVGDVLVRVETDTTLSSGDSLGVVMSDLLGLQRVQLRQRVARQQERRDSLHDHLQRRISSHREQAVHLERQLALQRERLALMETRYQALAGVRREQLISEEGYQSRYQALLDARQEYERLRQSLMAEQSRQAEAEYELASLDRDTAEAIDQLESEIAGIEQRMAQQQGDEGFVIRAPVAGQVTSLQAGPGKRVHPQRPLMAILPKDTGLEVDLLVPTQAIGFITTGLPVQLRYHAFPYERFGMHEARVTEVAKTILAPEEVDSPVRIDTPVYRVRASLDQTAMLAYGQAMPLQSGMTLEASIQLEKRPLYQWLLRPLYTLGGAL